MELEQSIFAPFGAGQAAQVRLPRYRMTKDGMFDWLRRFTIRTRIIGSFATGAVLTAVVGVLGYVSDDKRLFLCAVAYIVVASVFFGWWIAGSIIRPIEKLRQRFLDVAEGEGDLTKRMSESGNDEIGDAAGRFNLFMGKLHDIVSQVAGTSSQVAAAAGRLHTVAERIAGSSEGIVTQARAVAIAAEEVAANSGDISRNCLAASAEAQRASLSAQNGVAVVQRTVTVMGRIAERVTESTRTMESLGARSDQIWNIVHTIGDIADQTSLLALNAAIEAARAGDQGRGFSVVADEVRALAERTQNATREIEALIMSIQGEINEAVTTMAKGVHHVQEGTAEAESSGMALRDILGKIDSLAALVHRISGAAEEQAVSGNDITVAIQTIADAAQSTSLSVMESAAAASQLHGNADGLQRLIGHFKL